MINYDKQFNDKINRIVREFNSKVNKLEKQGIKYIPEKVSVIDLKTTYFERDSLKRRLRQLQRFSHKGAEEIVELQGGAKTTKWELETLKSDITYLKRMYSNKIKSYGNKVPTILGKKQAVTYAKMGDAKYENLKILRRSLEKDLNNLEQADFNKFNRKVKAQNKRREKQKYILFANYFTFIDDVGYKAGIPQEEIDKLKEKLAKMDVDDFIELFETEKSFSSVIEYYDIQKLKAGGYSEDDISTVERMFETINDYVDKYSHD